MNIKTSFLFENLFGVFLHPRKTIRNVIVLDFPIRILPIFSIFSILLMFIPDKNNVPMFIVLYPSFTIIGFAFFNALWFYLVSVCGLFFLFCR